MTPWAYYNEIEPFAAEHLRNLINAGHIAPGVVDTRSIEDVHPLDLREFTQCHFFAGVGVWSHALRLAGWPDGRPVWTGSCPCQPFSKAGKGAGFDDERHLWPAWLHLIGQCRPPSLLGEQVSGPDAWPWIDLVLSDLEALGYAGGALPFPAAGIGAPNIRERLYWLARAVRPGRAEGWAGPGVGQAPRGGGAGSVAGTDGGGGRLAWGEGRQAMGHGAATQPNSGPGGLGDACSARPSVCEREALGRAGRREERGATQQPSGALGGVGHADGLDSGRHPGPSVGAQSGLAVRPVGHGFGAPGATSGVADAHGRDAGAERQQRSGQQRQQPQDGRGGDGNSGAGPTNGFWRDADWIFCRDGKWRPVEPGAFPLVDGAPGRVGRLRAYGNAINAQAARVFIQAAEGLMP